ncbi:LOW QUALITY PROTEIN: tudor domain-containing protein 5-like [Cydia amplana]|uniref:LOW QUALITY PROTEIN: tudor domain-containing protein 5-like n=1 Tax=Cydia amplana TaxID=1869771 RepID=UPI002FE5B040
MADLEGLKKVLRSLVVSSATTMDAASLLRDYRRMLGEALPCAKHGFRDPVQFLRERCSDCFLFAGPQNNPILTLIVTDSIKHIDQFVQSQKCSKLVRGKRRSVPESIIRKPQPNLIANTFNLETNRIPNGRPITTPNRGYTGREPQTEPRKPEPVARYTAPCKLEPIAQYSEPRKTESFPQLVTKPVTMTPRPSAKKDESECSDAPSAKVEPVSNGHSEQEEADSHQRLQRFYRKRMLMYQSQKLGSKDSLRDDDSGRQTSSSLSERSATAWSSLQAEILRLVARRPEGVWCSELLRLYEEEYGHQLNFARFRYPSVSACACAVEGLSAQRAPDGNWLLTIQGSQKPSIRCEPALRLRRVPRDSSLSASRHASRTLLDADDALPGIDYDPDVFPADCLSFLESIPPGSLAGVGPGDMLPVLVAEVYSPSHLWLQRLGPEHELMQEYMDQMTEYYSKGEGADRVLAAGARRPGQYCSSVFEGDWHRSLIVQIVDSDTVKVRHVDYGTVDAVAATSLRPLRRCWAALPAAAVRARLAGLRPAAASRRWPRAAAAHCLDLVRERRLVGNVVAVDHEESILEVLLIDTSTDEDVNITEQMIRAGHADARALPQLGARDGYLLPAFHALEHGLTPNYTEIHALLRDGIALDFVDSYRNHVPACCPPPATTADCGPRPALAANRVPVALSLLRLAPEPPSPEPSPVPDSTPAASPRDLSAESDSPVPETQERCMTPAAPCCAPRPPAPHPASFYALPYCPCTQAYKPQVQVPVSVPVLRSYSPGYFRPRVSPQQYYPRLAPPVSMNYYGPPVFHPAPRHFPVTPHPPDPQRFAPNSMQNPQQFVPNATRNFRPYPGPNPHGPAPNSPNFGPGPGPNPSNFGPSPGPYSPNFGPAPTQQNNGAGSPNLQSAPRPPNCGPGSLRASSNCLSGADGPSVRLSAEECEIFELLSRVDPGAAHRYMIAALRRARGGGLADRPGGPDRPPGLGPERPPGLNPDAAEFRAPPGFENFTK